MWPWVDRRRLWRTIGWADMSGLIKREPFVQSGNYIGPLNFARKRAKVCNSGIFSCRKNVPHLLLKGGSSAQMFLY